MPIELREITQGQLSRLERAQAVTRDQIDLAIDLVQVKFNGVSADNHLLLVAAVTQALATNYLAETVQTKALN